MPEPTFHPSPVWAPLQGLMVNVPSPMLDDRASDNLQNVSNTVDGRLSIRPGFQDQHTAGVYDLLTGESLLALTYRPDNPAMAVAITFKASTPETKFYVNAAGTAWTLLPPLAHANFNNLGNGLDAPMTWALFKQKVFFAQKGFQFQGGIAQPVFYDGATANIQELTNASALLQPPSQPAIVLAASSGSHLFFLGGNSTVDSHGQGVSWSGFLDETLWNGGQNGGGSGNVLLRDDNDAITAGSIFGPFVLVFKPRSMYVGVFLGSPQFWQFTRREEDRGCVSHNTIGSFNNMRIWLGDDNVYMFDGNTVQNMADKVLQRFVSQMNPAFAHRAFAVVDRYRRQYHLFLPLTGTSTILKLFTFDLSSGAWYEGLVDTSIAPNCALQQRQFNNTNAATFLNGYQPWTEKHLVGSTDGHIYDFTAAATLDGAAAIPTPFWETKILDAVALAQGQLERAQIGGVAVHASAGQLNVKVAASDRYESMAPNNIQFEPVGVLTFDGKSRTEISTRVDARFLKLRFEWVTPSSAPGVEGYTCWLKPTGGRSGR